MTSNLTTVSYIGAAILFILSPAGWPIPRPHAAATCSA